LSKTDTSSHQIEYTSDTSRSAHKFPGGIVGILIDEGNLTPDQVNYALKVQEKLDTPKRLLDVFKELGYIRDEQIKESLQKNRTCIPLGLLLTELGLLSEKQLAMALDKQKKLKGHKRLGTVLVENNYITEYELVQSLSMHLGFPYVEPKAKMLIPTLMEKAPKQFYLKNNILPLSEEHGAVNVVMADPLDNTALEAAKKLFRADINVYITKVKLIRDVLEKYDSLQDSSRRVDASENQIVEFVDNLIQEALKLQVSDIHLEPMKDRTRVRFRKDGSLIYHTDFSKDLEKAVASRIKIMAGANIAERRRHQDGRILLGSSQNEGEVDIRVSFYVTLFGEKVVMRILTKKADLFTIGDLGMASNMLSRFQEEVLDLPTGVIISTGPTGAGKTTTLYAAINYCSNIDTSIITAEEPVEYIINGIAQCSINPEIGLTFAESLKHMLRQDPDIIVLGEIRDRYSAESAIQAALTGHKVLTTFHTEDSVGGLLRLMNMEIETFLISSTVVSVLAQRLLKKICPYCRETYMPSSRELRLLQYQPSNINNYEFKTGVGCNYCDFTGYQGRVGVFELLVLNEYVKDAILRRKTSYEIRRISVETTGLVTLLEDGMAKAAKGITSLQQVIKQLPLFGTPRPLDQIFRLIGEI
jgi:type IV pilus assembly protein PilB